MTPKPHNPINLPLICRPSQWFWWSIFGGLLLIVLVPLVAWVGAQHSATQDGLRAGAFTIALLAAPLLALQWYLIRCRIVVSEGGLEFVGLWKREFYAWDSIEDFETRFVSPGNANADLRANYLKIGGKWRKLGGQYTPQDQLLERIALQATQSRTHKWEINATRDDGVWPKTFAYPGGLAWLLQVPVGAFALVLVGICWLAHDAMIWLICSLIVTSMPYITATLRPPSRFKRQKISLTREELTQVNESQVISSPWDEITSYHFAELPVRWGFSSRLGVVESQAGRIEFAMSITQVQWLLAVIESRAKNAAQSGWRYLEGDDPEILPAAAPPRQSAETEAIIHHYRTRTERAFLLGGAVIFTVVLTLSILGVLHEVFNLGPFAIVMLGGGMLTYGWLRFQYASIECGKMGLRGRNVRGEAFIPWSDIEEFKLTEFGYIVGGKGTKVRFWPSISNLNELKTEITRASGKKCQGDRSNRA